MIHWLIYLLLYYAVGLVFTDWFLKRLGKSFASLAEEMELDVESDRLTHIVAVVVTVFFWPLGVIDLFVRGWRS